MERGSRDVRASKELTEGRRQALQDTPAKEAL